MADPISLEGVVEAIDGKLTIRIPLAVGGEALATLARGIGEIEKFTITRSALNDDPAG